EHAGTVDEVSKTPDVIETERQCRARDQARGQPVYCLGGDRHKGGARPVQALVLNVGTLVPMLRENFEVADRRRSRVPMRGEGADGLVVAKKPGNAGGAKRPDDRAEG